MLFNSSSRIGLSSSEIFPIVKRTFRRKVPPPGKPPILPPAKRVLYNVNHREWDKPEHVEELLWRRHVYTSAMESIRKVFATEIVQKELEGLAIEGLRTQELNELDELIAVNERRNQEAAQMRKNAENERFEKIREEMMKQIDAEIAEQHQVNEEKTIEVREMIKRSADFVTYENLDEKLNEALESPPVVFDFAIDVEGTKIVQPTPIKYQTGTPTRQKSRLYDELWLSGQEKKIEAGGSQKN
ncbi:hypothetical protein M3Y94_01143700 [Aphelenchoides besseyi]|nr:hypothetical protein M3Y94_01143700 [Aphelenchoides besseyi]KAI6227889.1 hypothetical protein M3Y95_00564400 [Aphelenchoides besseyi]